MNKKKIIFGVIIITIMIAFIPVVNFFLEYNIKRNDLIENPTYPPMLQFDQNIYYSSLAWMLETDQLTQIGEVESRVDGAPTKDNESNRHEVGTPIYQGPDDTIIVPNERYYIIMKQEGNKLFVELEKVDEGSGEQHTYQSMMREGRALIENFFYDCTLYQESFEFTEMENAEEYYVFHKTYSDGSKADFKLFLFEDKPYFLKIGKTTCYNVDQKRYEEFLTVINDRSIFLDIKVNE